MHTSHWQLIAALAIAMSAAGCGAEDAPSPHRASRDFTWSSGDSTSREPTPNHDVIECREDFDCCENPTVPCGQVCEDDACVAAPMPPPVEPAIDLSIEASWATSDLLDLPDGTPVLVRTELEGFTPVDLAAVLRGFVENPISGDARDPYLLLETDPADERWVLTNGPAAGMSGSPIIIENRHAGALSFSVGDTVAPFLFIATPIEKMLAVDAASPDDAGSAGGATPRSAVFGIPNGAAQWFTDTGVFDDRFVAIPNGALGVTGAGNATDPGPFVPGSAIAVLLITGDLINSGGIGTVTAIDDDRVWAFGHPMMQSGTTALPFSGAEVLSVAANPTWGAYKIASPAGELLGTITGDHTAAIAGRLGPLPSMIATHVESTYDGTTQDAEHQTARVSDPFGTAQFAAFALVWPISVQRDRVASGSIAYDLTVTVGETDLTGHRRDIVSSSFWTEQELFYDLYFRLGVLIGDSRIPLTLNRVELTADVSDGRREITINHVDAAETIEPGDDLIVAVSLLSFGSSEADSQAFVLNVPEDFPVGPAVLDVGPETMLGIPPTEPSEEEDSAPDTAEEIIAAFNALPRSQVLIVRLTSLVSPPMPECPLCEGDAPCEPCELPPPSSDPPPPQPSLQVSTEEGAVVNGFESRTIEISSGSSTP